MCEHPDCGTITLGVLCRRLDSYESPDEFENEVIKKITETLIQMDHPTIRRSPSGYRSRGDDDEHHRIGSALLEIARALGGRMLAELVTPLVLTLAALIARAAA